MIFFLVYIGVNILFLLWVWGKYTMNDQMNKVRGFVAHCVRFINNGEHSESDELFESESGVKTEILIPYGLFVVNTEEQMFHTANTVFDMAVIEFPPNQGWNISILSSDESHYISSVQSLKDAIS